MSYIWGLITGFLLFAFIINIYFELWEKYGGEPIVRSWFIKWATAREADVVIGGKDNPYLIRWYFIPRNPFFNIYIHLFLRSDDDRALHDHPWINASWLLHGSYTEHRIEQGGINKRILAIEGDFTFRHTGKIAHRIELHRGACWTLFITGPAYRHWGFHCSEKGWVHWKDFTSPLDSGLTGKGCDD